MKKSVITSVFALSLLGAAQGGDFGGKGLTPLASPIVENCLSYDFIDLDYGVYDFGDDFADDGELFGIGFSKSIGSSFYFTGGYAMGGYDFDWGQELLDVDVDRYRFGLGGHRSLAKCVDLTLEGGFEHTDAEYECYPHLDYDSWAYYVGPGIRARTGRLELFAKALFVGREGDLSQQYLAMMTADHLGVDEDGWVFSTGMIFHLTEHLGIKLAGEFGESDNLYSGGIRYEF